ncbi:uncharacterized protein LOC143848703 [Tasmannia lanceolata]|uniref:uncharacterized protein LOC143848703 n=1 Tax=Tasmannia lanceolata TaxID=3420 RepID=UPI004062FE91
MSAGVCGKRIGFEEIFGSSGPSSSAKRSRCLRFGSPNRNSDFGFGSEDKVSILLRMFPSMDRELVETVLNSHNHKIEDAIESLHTPSLGDASAKSVSLNLDSMVIASANAFQDCENTLTSVKKIEDLQNDNTNFETRIPIYGSPWVDIFVQEMMNASDLDDARGRATRILETFEQSVVAHSRELGEREMASLKEHLQNLLRDNQILKRAVTIQHERNSEQEEKVREVQQLKHVLSQYQEQVRTLEVNNYILKLHLQRAQNRSSIPGHFHPDVL